ncbi:hypothetical protein ABID65_002222 [Bradyrhizobium sp. S3.9.2]|uniref:DUF2971 domain-containing protein n=1 Tax=Bradyrhizobium sp. S3.9.2 TaxID=3156432 RepID=UPI0033981B14
MTVDANSGTEDEVQARLFKHFLQHKNLAGRIFYHYCSMETFRVICETKALRYSDINMMNDVTEYAWGYRVFEDAATRLLKLDPKPSGLQGVDVPFFDDVDKVMSPMQLFLHPVMCSFSKNPDVLSQWRSYADDGRGVAIGFTADCFAKMPVSLMNVEYDHEKQLTEMADILAALYDVERSGGHKRGEDFDGMCKEVAMYKLAFKNPAFFEEQEVRSLHLLQVKRDEGAITLFDPGGWLSSRENEVAGQPVKFRTRDGFIVPFVDIPFVVGKQNQPIAEVWLGPKNENADGNIMYLMNNNGFSGYQLKRSAASYR